MYGTDALIALAVAAPVALAMAICDLRRMTIPNWLTGGAAVLFTALVFVMLPADQALWRVAAALIVLIVGFGLFAIGAMGGGDAKAAAALTPLIAPADASVALFLLSVIGLLGIAVFYVLRRTSLAGPIWRERSARRLLPYGVTLGATVVIYLTLAAMLV